MTSFSAHGLPSPAPLPSRQQLAAEVYGAWSYRDLTRTVDRWQRKFTQRYANTWQRTVCTQCGVLIRTARAIILDEVGTTIELRHWSCPLCLEWDRLATAMRRFEWIGQANDCTWQVGFNGNVLLVNNRCAKSTATPAWVLDPGMDQGDIDELLEGLAKRRARPNGEMLWIPANSGIGINAERSLSRFGFRIGWREPMRSWQPFPVAQPAARRPALVLESVVNWSAGPADGQQDTQD
jgi:hypothetical protein